MLNNIFNSAGIKQKNHVLCEENSIIYYASSSNIVIYSNNKTTPIIRHGPNITNLKVRDGIILSDEKNRVEFNNRIIFECDSAVLTVNKTKLVSYEDMFIDICVFSTVFRVYIFCCNQTFCIDCSEVISLDCIILCTDLILLCGTISGKIHKIKIGLENIIQKKDGKNNNIRPGKLNHKTYEKFYEGVCRMEPPGSIMQINSFAEDTVIAHLDAVKDIKINKTTILTSSQDKTIKLFDLTSLKHIDTLIGHDDYVYESNFVANCDKIISAGADGCAIIWEHKKQKWQSKMRLGKLMNGVSFYNAIMIYRNQPTVISNKEKTHHNVVFEDYIVFIQSHDGGLFQYCNGQLVLSVSGNTDCVVSLDVKKNYILTGSLDKTTRLYYKLKEVARPCIHGYSIKSAVFFGEYVVVGSSENIIRVYEMTSGLKKILCEIDKNDGLYPSGSPKDNAGKENNEHVDNCYTIATPSELSLTNEIRKLNAAELHEYMLQNTLCFRENKKIYGQFFANSCMVSNDKIVLCANKSSTPKFSGIFLIVEFSIVQYIAVHELGIEKMDISANDKYVVAASRDKSVSLYEIITVNKHTENNDCVGYFDREIRPRMDKNIFNKCFGQSKYYLLFKAKFNTHARRISAVCFDDITSCFVTGSKDKRLIAYSIDDHIIINSIDLKEEITALRFYRNKLFIGLESGKLCVLDGMNLSNQIFQKKIHSGTINDIKFHDNMMVTVGNDNMMRVFEIDISRFM